MSVKSKLMLSRAQLAAFLSDPDAIKQFERVFTACDVVEDMPPLWAKATVLSPTLTAMSPLTGFSFNDVVDAASTATASFVLLGNGLKLIWETVVQTVAITTVVGTLFGGLTGWNPTYPFPTAWVQTFLSCDLFSVNPVWPISFHQPTDFRILSTASFSPALTLHWFAIGHN
jgi:hypothetical protein